MTDQFETAEAQAEALLRVTELFAKTDPARVHERLEKNDLAGFYSELGLSFEEGELLRAQLQPSSETATVDLNPVKPPFALVRSLVTISPGKRIVATAGLGSTDWRVAGHFGAEPVMPGMLQLEALAQASAITMLAGSGKSGDHIPLCARVENARFYRVVGPAEELRLEATLSPMRRSFGRADVKASVAGQTSVSGRLTLFEDGLRLHVNEAIPQPVHDDVLHQSDGPPDARDISDAPLLPEDLEERSLLPSREPFILLDSAQIAEAGQHAVAKLRVSGDEWFLQGHFPGFQVLPGMMQLEALAQTSAIALLSHPKNQGHVPVCVAVPIARFTRVVRPGDEMTLEATVSPLGGAFHVAQVRGWVDEEMAVDGKMIIYLNGSLSVGSELPQAY